MGFFPGAIAPRVGYDIDGSKVFLITPSTATIAELNLSQRSALNDESSSVGVSFGGSTGTRYLFFELPETMDILAYTVIASANTGNIGWGFGQVQYSNDTTNGLDGTWTASENITGYNSSTPGILYRSFKALSVPIKSKFIRFGISTTSNAATVSVNTINIYASISTTPIDQRSFLEFWHPINDIPISGDYFDFEDVARNTTNTKTFRLKNFNQLTANNVNLTISVLTDQNPSLLTQYALSLDNQTYQSSITLSQPISGLQNNISPIIYLKRTTASNAVLGLNSGRISVTVGSWT